jgi:hypothetical protein
MNQSHNHRKVLISRNAGAWGMVASVVLGCGWIATPRLMAQPAANDPGKSIFDFGDDDKPKPKPPTLVKPETPPATTPTNPPATGTTATPPSPTPVAPAPPAPVTPAPAPPDPVPAPPKPKSTVSMVKGPPVKLPMPAAVDRTSLGLIAEQYSGSQFEKMTSSRSTSRVNAKITRNMKVDPPASGVIPVSIRWHGLLKAPQAGVYRFRLVAAAQTAVHLGGEAIFWGGPAPTTAFAAKSVELADGAYPIVIEASNISATEDVKLTLEWMLVNGFDWETVPASALCRVSTSGSNPNDPTVAVVPNKPAAPSRPVLPTPLAKGTAKVPEESAIAESRKKLRAAHATDFTDPKPLARLAFAKALMAEAASAKLAAEQFVYLSTAAEQFISAGDTPAAMTVVATAVATYDIDEAAFVLPAFTPAVKSVRSADQADALASALIGVADRTLAGGNIDQAIKVADLAVAAAKPSIGGTLRIKAHADKIKDVRTELQRLAVFSNKLKANPADPEPNTRLGKLHALLAGNWEMGLAMLAKGNDSELKLLAEMEKTPTNDRSVQQKLADAWWDRAAMEKEPYASGARSRAAAWYALLMTSESNEANKQKMTDRIVAASEAINLMALVDPRRDGLRGQWRWAGRDLFCEGRGLCALQIPVSPKGDYDYGVEFTVTAGDISVAQLLPGAASTFGWHMYQTSMYFEYESASTFGIGSSSGRSTGITGKQRHVSVIRVRGNSVKAYVDGQLAAEWNTNPSRVKGAKDWQLADATMLGIGCRESQIAVHAIKLVELPSPK